MVSAESEHEEYFCSAPAKLSTAPHPPMSPDTSWPSSNARNPSGRTNDGSRGKTLDSRRRSPTCSGSWSRARRPSSCPCSGQGRSPSKNSCRSPATSGRPPSPGTPRRRSRSSASLPQRRQRGPSSNRADHRSSSSTGRLSPAFPPAGTPASDDAKITEYPRLRNSAAGVLLLCYFSPGSG